MKLYTNIIVILIAASVGEAAKCSGSKQCQCLFNDGSHCCVYGSNMETGSDYDCTRLCAGASRLLQSGEKHPAKCNAGGKFSCASLITVQGRTPCYNNNAIP